MNTKLSSLDEILKLATSHLLANHHKKAIPLYEYALKVVNEDDASDLDFCANDICAIEYSLCLCYITDTKYYDKAYEELSLLVISYGKQFPALYYVKANLLLHQQLFEEASKCVEEGLLALSSISLHDVSNTNWPGTTTPIPESNLDVLMTHLKRIKILSSNRIILPESLIVNSIPDEYIKESNFQELVNKLDLAVNNQTITSSLKVDVPEFIPKGCSPLQLLTTNNFCSQIEIDSDQHIPRTVGMCAESNITNTVDKSVSAAVISTHQYSQTTKYEEPCQKCELAHKDSTIKVLTLEQENHTFQQKIADLTESLENLTKKYDEERECHRKLEKTVDIDSMKYQMELKDLMKTMDNEKKNFTLLFMVHSIRNNDFQKLIFNRHIGRCKSMIQALYDVKQYLTVTSIPTLNECMQHIELWKIELERSENCLKLLREYQEHILRDIESGKLAFPEPPVFSMVIDEPKNILQDSFPKAILKLVGDVHHLQAIKKYHDDYYQWWESQGKYTYQQQPCYSGTAAKPVQPEVTNPPLLGAPLHQSSFAPYSGPQGHAPPVMVNTNEIHKVVAPANNIPQKKSPSEKTNLEHSNAHKIKFPTEYKFNPVLNLNSPKTTEANNQDTIEDPQDIKLIQSYREPLLLGGLNESNRKVVNPNDTQTTDANNQDTIQNLVLIPSYNNLKRKYLMSPAVFDKANFKKEIPYFEREISRRNENNSEDKNKSSLQHNSNLSRNDKAYHLDKEATSLPKGLHKETELLLKDSTHDLLITGIEETDNFQNSLEPSAASGKHAEVLHSTTPLFNNYDHEPNTLTEAPTSDWNETIVKSENVHFLNGSSNKPQNIQSQTGSKSKEFSSKKYLLETASTQDIVTDFSLFPQKQAEFENTKLNTYDKSDSPKKENKKKHQTEKTRNPISRDLPDANIARKEVGKRDKSYQEEAIVQSQNTHTSIGNDGELVNLNQLLKKDSEVTQLGVSILAVGGPKFYNLFCYVRSRIPNMTEDEVWNALSSVKQKRGKLSGMSKDLIVATVQEELISLSKYDEKVTTKAAWSKINNEPVKWSNEQQDTSCVICIEPFEHFPITSLKCEHKFHTECIKQWFSTNCVCPVCRIHATMDEDFPPLGT